MSATPTTASARACASSSTSRASRSATARSRSRSTRAARCSTSAAARRRPPRSTPRRRVSRAEALLTARRRVPVGRRHGRPAHHEPRRRADRARRPRAGLARARWPCAQPRGDWNVVVSRPQRRGAGGLRLDHARRRHRAHLLAQPHPDDGQHRACATAATPTRRRSTTARQTFTLTDLNAGHQPAPRHVRRHRPPGVDADCTLRTRRARRRTPRAPTTSPAARTRSRRPPPTWRSRACSARTRRSASPASSPAPCRSTSHCISVDNSFFSDRRRRAAHGRRRRRRRRGLRRHRARVRPRDPGRPGARLRPRRPTPSSARWARASATSSPPTSTSRTATPTYQAARRFCVAEWDATSYNPVSGADDGSGCLRWADGTDEGNGADIGTYAGTPARSTTTAATGRRC